MAIKVFIGSDPGGKDRRAVDVLKTSIHMNTPLDVEFIIIGDDTGGTGFSEARWSIPERMNYEGYAIYLDSDMLVLGDIGELLDYRLPGHWVCSDTYPKGPSAVSVIDCSAYKNQPEGRNLKPSWEEERLFEAGILLPIIPEVWNMRNKTSKHAKLIHYTATNKQPWLVQGGRQIDQLWYAKENEYANLNDRP